MTQKLDTLVPATSTSIPHANSTSDPYIYVDDQLSLDELVKHLEEYRTVNTGAENHVFLDCEGRDLGCHGGKLGVVQIGIENNIYLIDVIKLEDSIPVIKEVLEDKNLVKIMWDARNDFSELWHGHGIHLKKVLDMQLVRIYDCQGQWMRQRKFLYLEGMKNAYSSIRKKTIFDKSNDIGVDRLSSG
jgi:hypothetical protein